MSVLWRALSDGVMVAQGSLEAFVMVRIHVGQPTFPMQIANRRMHIQGSGKGGSDAKGLFEVSSSPFRKTRLFAWIARSRIVTIN